MHLLASLASLLPTLVSSSSLGLLQAEEHADRIAEDVEILRRLLVQAIGPAEADSVFFGDIPLQGNSNNPLTVRLLRSTSTLSGRLAAGERVKHSRAFHLPGTGVFYSFDLELPLALAADSRSDDEKDDVESDWERVRREVRSGTSGNQPVLRFDQFVSQEEGRWEVDRDAKEHAIDAVLKTLAQHGQRLSGLDPGDSITVALHVEGSGSAPGAVYSVLGENEEDDANAQGRGLFWASVYAGQSAPERVVIQVPFDALRAGTNGAGFEEVKRRAIVHRY